MIAAHVCVCVCVCVMCNDGVCMCMDVIHGVYVYVPDKIVGRDREVMCPPSNLGSICEY